MKHALLATAMAALTTLTADAALITWGTAQNITGDSDVSTAGTLVGAINLGGANTTINGVDFTGLSLAGSSGSSGNFSFITAGSFVNGTGISPLAPFSTLSAPYQSLLGTLSAGGLNPWTLTLNGLSVGSQYEFQFWVSRSTFGGASTMATAGNSVSLQINTAFAQGGLGQFAIGTFTADATSQAITFNNGVGTNLSNGFQLRNLSTAAAVPEPGTALAGVMLAGLLGVRRRKGSRV